MKLPFGDSSPLVTETAETILIGLTTAAGSEIFTIKKNDIAIAALTRHATVAFTFNPVVYVDVPPGILVIAERRIASDDPRTASSCKGMQVAFVR